MASFDELIVVLKSLLTEQFAPKPAFVRGVLGDGTGVVNVPNRPDYDYARFNRGGTEAFEIFNKNAPSVDGWPVLIGEFPWQPGLTQVVGTDWAAYEQSGWGDSVTTSEPHAPTHEWRDGFIGADPVSIYRRAIAPGRAYSAAATGTVVFVNAFEYQDNTIWPGTPGVDLAPIRNALTTGNAQFAGIYVDSSNSLGVVTGSITVDTAAFDPPLVAFPFGTIPIARVRLAGGQGGIRESDFRDARRLWDFTSALAAWPIPDVIKIDGVDQASINDAFDNLDTNQIMRVGKGAYTWTLTSGYTFPGNTTIQGDSKDDTTITLSYTGTDADVLENSVFNSSIVFRDLTLIILANTATTIDGLQLANNTQVTFDRTNFSVSNVGAGSVLYAIRLANSCTIDAISSNLAVSGAASDLVLIPATSTGGFVLGDLTAGAAQDAILNGGTTTLRDTQLIAGILSGSGTYSGWYLDDDDNLINPGSEDVFSDNDSYGIFSRLVNYGFTPDEHWPQNSDELSWTGWAAYTGFVTPNSISTTFSIYRVADTTGSVRAFRYRSAATGAHIYLRARASVTQFSSAGVMIDDGSGNADGNGADNFFRAFVFQAALGGPVTAVQEYRTGGGAVTQTSATFEIDPEQFHGIMLHTSGTRWTSYQIVPSIFGESGERLQFTGGSGTHTWTPVRVGIFFANGGASGARKALFDWYDEATS